MAYINKIHIDYGRIIFRNFSGRPTPFNRSGGERKFSLILNQEDADRFAKEGWYIKYLKPREPGDEPTPYMDVKVRYHKDEPERNPQIYTLVGRKKTLLKESTVGTLDFAEIVKIDLVISPRKWYNEKTGERGVTAYLNQAVFTLEDYFGGKYDDYEEVLEDEEDKPW